MSGYEASAAAQTDRGRDAASRLAKYDDGPIVGRRCYCCERDKPRCLSDEGVPVCGVCKYTLERLSK